MSEERSFLKAIRAKPEDRTTRLVYADWLDEHDDARGALIRIEEELRTAPIHSDRYWELKPRRRALRKSIDRPWLKQMGYDGTDYRPVFADVPTGWKERWRLLREFAERWYQIPMDDVGGPLKPDPRDLGQLMNTYRQTIDDALNDPTVSAGLPPSLREWVFFVRDLQLGLDERDRYDLRPVLYGAWQRSALAQRDRPASQVIDFLLVYGGRSGCFVRANKREPDPPVWWVEHTEQDPRRGSSRIVVPHVTTLALHYLLMETDPSYGGSPSRQKMTKKLARRLENCFPVRADFDGTQLFERDNVIVVWAPESLFTEWCFHVRVRPPADPGEVFDQLFE